MPRIKLYTILFILSTFFFVACSNDDDNDNNPNNISNIVTQGTWRITLFSEDANNETDHYTGYTFTFQNGTVVASKTGSTVTGTYSFGTDDSQQKMYLNFGATEPFDELNDDWHILETTSSKIRLEDVSGGNGGTDLLTFEKN